MQTAKIQVRASTVVIPQYRLYASNEPFLIRTDQNVRMSKLNEAFVYRMVIWGCGLVLNANFGVLGGF